MRGGGVRLRRHDDLITVPQSERKINEVHGRGAGGNAHRMRRAGPARERFLECRGARPVHENGAVKDIENGCALRIADHGPPKRNVTEFGLTPWARYNSFRFQQF